MISRYLVSTRDDTEYSEKNELALYLDREELWGKKWEKEEEKIKTDLIELGKEKLTLGQCYELYNVLGGDESKTLENITIKKHEEEKDKINEEGGEGEDVGEEEGKIKKKPKVFKKPRRKV